MGGMTLGSQRPGVRGGSARIAGEAIPVPSRSRRRQAKVWGLAIQGADWAMVETDDGKSLFAVWPHRRYAEACRARHWAQREPTPIEVHEFIDGLIPKLITDGIDVAAFPCPMVVIYPSRPASSAAIWKRS